ncbi:uncharacterized protein MONBRDRAFT_38662 [Monosiga brevicollis MX1]|uniref:Eukaryotic translation initiation factor 5A n=1 Tax=Monosiga brevicollis TaxID=81824 RepID=A9V9A4_MONBE|nr:uncharacterized protein MONBRDRAFT_38662 [Monosiga brevicollis MX1]EDQ85827.1 predicted protein [Monosiga brevicollis MX1]|eukprot:XP_001749306.1 hypothetical protein [Monosiga brevicollis MX1]
MVAFTAFDMADEEFHAADAGASDVYPMQCSALRKNGHVVIKGRPCKIVDMSTSKTGKHGHAKVHLTAIDIFTGKKLEDICPSTHNMNVPNVRRTEYELVDIDDEGFMSLMTTDESGDTREDIQLDESSEIGQEIKSKFEDDSDDILVVIIQSAMGEEAPVAVKTSK